MPLTVWCCLTNYVCNDAAMLLSICFIAQTQQQQFARPTYNHLISFTMYRAWARLSFPPSFFCVPNACARDIDHVFPTSMSLHCCARALNIVLDRRCWQTFGSAWSRWLRIQCFAQIPLKSWRWLTSAADCKSANHDIEPEMFQLLLLRFYLLQVTEPVWDRAHEFRR